MDIRKFTVGPFSENTYLLTRDDRSILIDPGFFDPGEYEEFKKDLQQADTELIAVCLTHAHIDHVLGLKKVLSDFDLPVFLNHSDLYIWNHFSSQAQMFGFNHPGFDFIPEPLPEQVDFEIGPFSFGVLYTPGHSPDHISLYFKEVGATISGDALFFESIGRTDLYKGDFELLARSIKNKLYTLPDDTIVHPGHGPDTSVGHEKKHNPFVKRE